MRALLFAAALLAATPAAATPKSDVEATVRALWAAWATGDRAAGERIYDTTLIDTDPTGVRRRREAVLDFMKPSVGEKVEIAVTDLMVEVTGDTAFATYRFEDCRTPNTSMRQCVKLVASDYLVRRADGWKIAGAHQAVLPPAAKSPGATL